LSLPEGPGGLALVLSNQFGVFVRFSSFGGRHLHLPQKD
jgi:hypothetical protein